MNAGQHPAETAPVREALDYLVSQAIGSDYADAMRVHDAEWLIEDALGLLLTEPTGLGAVVKDEAGNRWTRARNQEHGFNWRAEWGDQWKQYADLGVPDEAHILSRGVTL